MDILDTRKCNIFNINMLESFLGTDSGALLKYYDELLNDLEFLESINIQISEIKIKWGFKKGIFGRETISSVDWFAFERVLIYILIRYLKPSAVLETGVYYGGNSAFALRALACNGSGKMVSIDYPDSEIRKDGTGDFRHDLVGDTEFYDSNLRPGFMVPNHLRLNWKLIEGDSLAVIPALFETFDFYIHDSDHSMGFLTKELEAAWERLSDDALILVDDIDWSNAFYAFCVQKRLYPLLMTDNGKDDLRVRTGIALKNHSRNRNDLFT